MVAVTFFGAGMFSVTIASIVVTPPLPFDHTRVSLTASTGVAAVGRSSFWIVDGAGRGAEHEPERV